MYRVTRGNPLAVLEMVRLGGASDLLDAPIPLSDSVEQAFASRAEQLSDAGHTALVVASADDSGDAATIIRAVRALGLEPGVLDEAEASGLVAIADGRLVFRHPLVRSALYQTAPASTRRAAHEALAVSLGGGGWQLVRRAWHRAAAAVEPDEQIAADLEATAREARERSGYGAAARALERAAALTPDGNAAAARLFAAADSILARWADGTGRTAAGRRAQPLLRSAACRRHPPPPRPPPALSRQLPERLRPPGRGRGCESRRTIRGERRTCWERRFTRSCSPTSARVASIARWRHFS